MDRRKLRTLYGLIELSRRGASGTHTPTNETRQSTSGLDRSTRPGSQRNPSLTHAWTGRANWLDTKPSTRTPGSRHTQMMLH